MNLRLLPVATILLCTLFLSVPTSAADTLETRRASYLKAFSQGSLPAEQNPLTWVDTERWCIAHASLTLGVRIDEANAYLSRVVPVSLSRGLIADTNVQVTDLLRTYLQFKGDKRLSREATAHLEAFFRDWRVPNPDRNRDADTRYEWPYEYTENHTLNILTASYLIDHATGRDRAARRELLERFLFDRAAYGWSEMLSPQYALVAAKALTLLVDFAPDKNIADAASMLLDIQALEFANHGLKHWRGVPFVRGAGMEIDNTLNAYFDLARYWFGDTAEPNPVYVGGHPFLVHVLTSRYTPPADAVDIVKNPTKRGTYTMRQTGTAGAGRVRIPINIHVSPAVTLASAQGYGSYYRGCYWSISLASSPKNVVTGSYNQSRNILQIDNVMATFGSANWYGSLKTTTEGNTRVGTDGAAYVGQITVAPECHLLLVGDTSQYPDLNAFAAALAKLAPNFSDGVLTWTQPNGGAVRMTNERDGQRWRITSATLDGQAIRLDSNMRFDSPHLRSVRGSGMVESLWNGTLTTYDFRDMKKPAVNRKRGTLTAIPSPRLDGALPGMEMIHIPPAEFPMGSPVGEGRSDEQPMRWVTVDGFYISRTEVTVGQWKRYLAENPAAAKPPEWFEREWGKTDQHAMTWVSWHEAKAFCDWLTKKTGKRHSLPTEAQWEKAAKGYAHTVYPWGNEYDGSQSGTPNETYDPVASKPTDASVFGVLDMAGNAWEWCADWYDPKAYRSEETHNPTGPATGTLRSIRGCGWNYDPETFRCSFRSRLHPDERAVHIGFRVVREE